ncbi:GNAT family N-acetyltransferase [Caldibacillus lycopersici]|uniref:GNAT family N-acetyltransferase n=1 Tax=Perspicuibacillus lycopersici TaxID=1325689 RepID=A0AAE3IRC5_9BACI|nr:GNAT family protein [Perspicuibacillus lycopersici]MCU9611991.1 GNAT family N-acetyltransferase [Perspicuibacillus lycopersici]
MFVHKITEELSLKLVDLHNANELFELTDANRDHLKKWLPWLDGTTSVEDTRAFIQQNKEGYAANRSLTTVILYNGKIVGTAGFNTINWFSKYVTIGYWLADTYQGKGIMTKTVEALITYAFDELKLNRVEICAAVENTKSRAIPERLGFKLEGVRRSAEWLYDHYVDHAIYGILANEWKTDTKATR